MRMVLVRLIFIFGAAILNGSCGESQEGRTAARAVERAAGAERSVEIEIELPGITSTQEILLVDVDPENPELVVDSYSCNESVGRDYVTTVRFGASGLLYSEAAIGADELNAHGIVVYLELTDPETGNEILSKSIPVWYQGVEMVIYEEGGIRLTLRKPERQEG